ncbi:TetR/AcrR family transcriptional regulator [Gordonia polyisoprenivorans]|uniref:TetR/AcrR family transcriptional regulator n=1 Tax=Gordonia polyisoprenivorans TaxID=84595 RepID=UPI001B8BFA1A|nr:TetR/AcrR family transcriptional regulator [Gordonia polyisoprenivorans]QUD81383.1 TetR/AcrR family transcriptional regulator [Gordonia polyisoprenivorans]
MDLEERAKPTRRRGAELEAAILDAAWDQLCDRGYGGLTFEAVAERAGTSRPVLYRRWTDRADLVRAVIRRRGELAAPVLADTGTLRGDLLAALRDANRNRSNFLVMLSAALGEFYAETGDTPRDLRAVLFDGRPSNLDTILERAVARGEVDPARLTARVVAVPFDLYRHEVMMTLAPVADETLEEIVDEVFLPLVSSGPG